MTFGKVVKFFGEAPKNTFFWSYKHTQKLINFYLFVHKLCGGGDFIYTLYNKVYAKVKPTAAVLAQTTSGIFSLTSASHLVTLPRINSIITGDGVSGARVGAAVGER